MKKLTIRAKLLLSFSITILIALIIGFTGYSSLSKVEKLFTKVTSENIPCIIHLGGIESNLEGLQKCYLKLTAINLTKIERENILAEIAEYRNQYKSDADECGKYKMSAEETLIYNEFLKNVQDWREFNLNNVNKANEKIMHLLVNGGSELALEQQYILLRENIFQSIQYHQKVITSIVKLKQINRTNVAITTENGKEMAKTATLWLIIFVILGAIIAITIAIYISNNITAILENLTYEINSQVNAATNGILTTRANPENINFEFREIIVGVNNMLNAITVPITFAANYISRLSVGDNPPIITSEYKGDFNELKVNLNALIDVNNVIVNNAKRIAAGDLTVKLNKRHPNDELLGALANMVETLNESITRISEAADEIASGSEETSQSSMTIAQGASEQAASAEEISASIEEMASSIQQNSENAVDTERIATNVSNGIAEVNRTSQNSLEAIRIIAGKIKVINSIAEKTDILAINAAIEAARAGEHGKGFAVVAAEVRKLAEISQKASIEINNLSSSSLNATEESSQLMVKIIPEIQNTAKLVQEIAATSNEQTAGATQIAKAVDQFSQVTQQNSASSEELSSSAQELNAQAELLREIVSFFKTGKENKKLIVKADNKTNNKTVLNGKTMAKTKFTIDLIPESNGHLNGNCYEKF